MVVGLRGGSWRCPGLDGKFVVIGMDMASVMARGMTGNGTRSIRSSSGEMRYVYMNDE